MVPGGSGVFWAGSEAGLSRFDGTWSYQNANTNMPFADVRTLAAAGPDEVWAGGPSSVAWLKDGTWAVFSAAQGHLPSNSVNDLLVAPGGEVFFATSAGVASFDPVSLVWTQHPDAGAGSAGALVFSPPGRVWAGSNDAGQGRVAEYNPSLGVPLVAPADRARRVTDASGLQTLTLEWAEAAGATGYEVFLNGAPLGRTTATSREVLLGAGEYTWTVRALYGDTAGPRSVPFRFSVGEGRQQQDLEFLLVHQTAQGHTRVLDVFQTRGTGIWSTFLIDPRFRESQMNASVDLAATSDARLASVSFDGVSALPEQYPTRLLSSVQARPSPSAWRVDATSEPGGLVLSGIPSQDYFVLYNSLKGERQVSGARATDVAGLTRGRFAVLDAAEPLVRVYQRDDPARCGQPAGRNPPRRGRRPAGDHRPPGRRVRPPDVHERRAPRRGGLLRRLLRAPALDPDYRRRRFRRDRHRPGRRRGGAHLPPHHGSGRPAPFS